MVGGVGGSGHELHILVAAMAGGLGNIDKWQNLAGKGQGCERPGGRRSPTATEVAVCEEDNLS